MEGGSVLRRGDAPAMPRPRKYPDELVARGVRQALESGRPIAHVAADLGMHPETLRKKVRQAQAGERVLRAVRGAFLEIAFLTELVGEVGKADDTPAGVCAKA